ncbi:MAG: hypothetical protein WC346_11245 [Methanogenium sp.]|jgi:hypothetical protein
MRLISNDTYSFGEGTFAWSGVIDPKLYQRYTWLLTIPIFTPVAIGVVGVSSNRFISGISTKSFGISVSNTKVSVSV